ncbi:hypothetical protein [Subtercola boreus]|uniref:hypothetical protein n=1 Tax=Subtercola boreus TaxID=120213 RepID=UPI0011C04298|nr:hypothetical protein [Subtercola boreus]
MKSRDLDKRIRQLAKTAGASVLFDNGGKHDVFTVNGTLVVVPRHSEIGEMLARTIIKQVMEAAK